MRRWILVSALLLLFSLPFCYRQILGGFLKVITKSETQSLLAYRDLRLKGGTLILKEIVLFNPSYLLNAEEMVLTLHWPFSFSIHIDKPHILLTPKHFKENSLSTSSRFPWLVQLEEGTLEWADRSLPSSQFSLLLTSDSIELGMSCGRGVLELKKKGAICRSEWSHLPLDFLLVAAGWGGLSLPISHLQGTVQGEAEMNLEQKTISLEGFGDALSFEWHKLRLGGSLALKGTWRDNSLETIRLSLQDGRLASSTSTITQIESKITYQAGLGTKITGKGASDSLEIAWEGRSFFRGDELKWADATAQLGKAVGSLRWGGEWAFNWEGLGVEEISLCQGFAAEWFSTIRDWQWHAGTVRGVGSLHEGLTIIQLDNVKLETPHFHFETKKGSYRKDDWEVEEFILSHESMTLRGNGKWHTEREENRVAFVGEIAGIRFAGMGEREGENYLLSIPRFEGEIPPSLWPGTRGKIEAMGNGIEVRGQGDWLFSARVTEGSAVHGHATISQFACNVLATPESIDILAAKGKLSASFGEHLFNASLFAPRIQWKGDSSLFDLRLYDGATDLLRLKGTKEAETVELDSAHSHFFGQPIALKKGVWNKTLAIETDIDWPLCALYLQRLGLWAEIPKLEKFHFTGHVADQNISFSLDSPLGWSLTGETNGASWTSSLSWGQTHGHCTVEYKAGLFRAHAGQIRGPDISFAFEGTMNRKFEGALTLKNIWADLKLVSFIPLEGNVEGQAQISFTKDEFQSDLDLVLKEALYEGFSFENTTPLHLYYSSLQGTRIKGIDCRIHKESLEAHVKMDLLKFEKIQNRWTIQKAKTHIPSDFFNTPFLDRGAYLDCLAELAFSSDFSEWHCTVKEGLIPIQGSVRHIKNLRFFGKEDSFFTDAFVRHNGKWAKLSLELTHSTPIRGRFYLEEPDRSEDPLSIDWSYEKETGLSVLSIEGAFAGLDASFHAFEPGRLIGSTRLDFRRLSEWLPHEVAKGFDELKLGKGYELKGNLQIDPQQLSNVSFQGIFSGKQIELAGFQFRTLLARADLNPTFYRIHDLKVSDSAGLLKIDDIQMKQVKGQPWTIEIPKFLIEELRPSLLVKPGEEAGPVSPLVIRQFKMVDFHGLLDDGKTWLARGELSFINSFKREETVFDLPANVLGRIVGLDLDLLIPVRGELTFGLRDGYFHLEELSEAYSEGQRSEFFLVQSEADWPRMDLDGNLQILVKMKQFVLFSLTEAFMISIGGKLNDPHFSLQKKKRFL